jgi:hypothetical protein
LRDAREQQARQAALIDRKAEPRHVQHRHLAHAQSRAARGAHAHVGVDVDLAGLQFPPAVAGRAGRVRRAEQGADGAVHADVVGATVAATRGQLVLHTVHTVGLGDRVTFHAIGHDAHAAVLVAHVAVGDEGAVVLRELQVVGAKKLVAAAQGHVAGDVAGEITVHAREAVEGIAVDVGGLGLALCERADRCLGVGEGGHRVLDRTQRPVIRTELLVGVGGQRNRDAER